MLLSFLKVPRWDLSKNPGDNDTFAGAIQDGLGKIIIREGKGHKQNLILGILDQFDQAHNSAVIRREEHFKLGSIYIQD